MSENLETLIEIHKCKKCDACPELEIKEKSISLTVNCTCEGIDSGAFFKIK